VKVVPSHVQKLELAGLSLVTAMLSAAVPVAVRGCLAVSVAPLVGVLRIV
jgi:hypothetical protein